MRGVSLVEIMVVLGIILLLFAVGAPFYSSYHIRHILAETTQEVVESLRYAQTQAASAYDGQDHGVHFKTNSYTIFIGSTYDEFDHVNNQTFTIDRKISFSDISFSASDDIVFSKKAGNAVAGYVIITDMAGTNIRISVTEIGVVDSARL